ncbi:MAG: DNA repair protein RadA [Chloroherpetonaceae bacterium]|nr:DNA repair protein RadA [Chloroherpetonaceae bacterium]MDW8438808.1 DNA repair protein RadA [Chloroherpetonaceae bacterium]
MPKTKTRYVCSNCGASYIKYQGRCNECQSWGTLVEEVIKDDEPKKSGTTLARPSAIATPKRLREIETLKEERILTGIREFDHALGGGLMASSVVLIGGEPGIGKSTLMLQIVPNLAEKRILYVSAEESLHQIRARAERMGVESDNFFLLAETELENVLEAIASQKPDIVIVDSIQTIFSNQLESSPGSVSQVRECAAKLMQASKREGMATFIIGHITKEGAIAGPKVLEHIVDTVLQFEGDAHYRYRILRALKNRFGATNELGVFEMSERGLVEVRNPSEIFLSERSYGASGSCVAATMEGTRPLLVEIQALVTKANYAAPQRISSGFDQRRLALLLAVLEKRLGLPMWSRDVFLNVAGGLRLDEPAIDLAVAVAIVSSLRDIPADSSACAIGEVGLAGELRAVAHLERRVMEAKKLGFEKVVAPKQSNETLQTLSKRHQIELVPCPTLNAALNAFLA